MIVQIQRTLNGDSDQVTIRNQDGSLAWTGPTSDNLRIWLGSRMMVYADAHLTEVGVGVDHAVG
jgi:hypothetical protein